MNDLEGWWALDRLEVLRNPKVSKFTLRRETIVGHRTFHHFHVSGILERFRFSDLAAENEALSVLSV